VRRWGILAAAIAAFLGVLAALFVLIGGLAHLELLPGTATAPPAEEAASARTVPTGEDAPNTRALQLVIRILVIGAMAVFVLGMLFSRSFRRDFLQRVLVLGITLVVMILFAVLLMNSAERSQEEWVGPESLDAPPVEAMASSAEDTAPSGWSVALFGVLVAVALVGAAAWIALTLHRRAAQRPLRKPLLEEIAETAREASRRLRAGDPVARVVLDCYRTMSRLLVEEEGVPYDEWMTPQEFAERLQSRGMRSEHAQRLTRIFEMVRYGGRSSPVLAEEATACLDAIRDRYAAVGAA
jgi:hypothetical protein